jgi:hypothetical protein
LNSSTLTLQNFPFSYFTFRYIMMEILCLVFLAYDSFPKRNSSLYGWDTHYRSFFKIILKVNTRDIKHEKRKISFFNIWDFRVSLWNIRRKVYWDRRRYFIRWLQKIRRNLGVGFSETSVTIYKNIDRNFNLLHYICSLQIVTFVVIEWLFFLSSISCIVTRRAERLLGVIL